MDLKKLRHFNSAVKAGSISAAAQAVGVTQQALSRSITLLEEEVGVELLERTRTGVSPTPRGNDFYKLSSRLVSEFDNEMANFLGSVSLRKVIEFGISDACMIGPGITPFLKALERVGIRGANHSMVLNSKIGQKLHSAQFDFAVAAYHESEIQKNLFTKIGNLRLFVVSYCSEISSQIAASAVLRSGVTIIGNQEYSVADRILYESFIDATATYPDIGYRSNCAASIRDVLKSIKSAYFFLCTDAKVAEDFWGGHCREVSWAKETVPYGLLTNRTSPVSLDWPTFSEYSARYCGQIHTR
ncbi:LysR family transcriptional regulator [Hyphomonadaceae bacterium ML37]|nr:LysR family transcriptional regulator [Hyphomonadaceae bacterium ML37]